MLAESRPWKSWGSANVGSPTPTRKGRPRLAVPRGLNHLPDDLLQLAIAEMS